MTPDWILGYLFLLIKLSLVLIALLLAAAYLTLAERKLLGRMQVRYGPNRAGPFGLLQPLADIIKLLTKEDTVPQGADRLIFLLAPAVVAATALAHLCRHPLRQGLDLRGPAVPLVITDLNIGLLYVLALASLSVYGVALGGWASNSKYSLVGGHPRCGPDDQLRTLPGALAGPGGHAGPVFQPGGYR